jgi:hypothetical protein
MVKQFHLKIPQRSRKSSQQKLNEQTPAYVDLDYPQLPDVSLPDIEIETSSITNFPDAFHKLPNPDMLSSVSVQKWEYIQHRMEDEGRAIALARHPRKALVQVDGNVWTFKHYDSAGWSNAPTLKTYTVEWDGVGDPLVVMGVEKTSANPGGTNQKASNPLSSSTFGQYAPDPFVWAVYFSVNPAPADADWIPNAIPTLSVGPPWPSYDLNLA